MPIDNICRIHAMTLTPLVFNRNNKDSVMSNMYDD